MKINPLPGFGYEVEGVAVSHMVAVDFQRLRSTFAKAGLVVIRDQHLSEQEHLAFARRFGNININRFFTPHPDFPEIALVIKKPEQHGVIGGEWHTDHSYDLAPAMGSLLLARTVPPSGGDTLFASTYGVLDRLPAKIRERLFDLQAVHSARHVFGSAYLPNGGDRLGNSKVADELPDQVHPVIIRHPLSGKPALFVNPQFTVRLGGCSPDESAELLRLIAGIATDPVHLARVKWREGSMTIWDNRATWHCALDDYPGHTRIMHRITVEGCLLQRAEP